MLPGLPDNMVAGFQGQQRDREGGRKRGKICVAFFDLTSDVIQHHFYYILSVKEFTKIPSSSKGENKKRTS